jgi:ATP/maltotriose-dependent transcriptional regulator MalT
MQHSKLSLPRLAQGTARPRLFSRLDNARIAWVAAPAGAGKTTLAATYILARHTPYLWYQLDKDDSDPATFFYYLGIAINQALSKKISLPLLSAEYFSDIPAFAKLYFHILTSSIPPGSALILDNYQEIADDAPLPQILLAAIKAMSSRVRFIILSRGLPPSIITANINAQQFTVIGWDEIRLTLKESRAIITQRRKIEEYKITALHNLAGGWPAGITLLMEQPHHDVSTWQTIAPGSMETIFSFFTHEFFANLAVPTQEFLLKTSIPLQVTPILAEEITGNINADGILEDLHNRQFFIHRREHAEIRYYQYHSLLREYLLSRLTELYSPGSYKELIRHSASILLKHGQEEEAIVLYLQHCEWEIGIPLVLSQAPKLMAFGRTQILAGWLGCLPDSWLKSTPWLLYWKGISQMGLEPFMAQELLQTAFASFDSEANSIGKILSASAIIDISYFLRKSLLSAKPWVDALLKELALKPDFPSPEVEARVLTSLLSLLTYLHPQEDNIPHYVNRLSQLMAHDLSANQKVHSAIYLVHYYTLVSTSFQSCESLIASTETLIQTQEVSALNKILWGILSSPYYALTNNQTKAYDTVIPLPALASQHNLKFMEGLTAIYVAAIHHNFGDSDTTSGLIQQAEKLIVNAHPADIAWLNLAKAMSSLCQGEYAAALKFGTNSLRLTEALGATLILIEIHCLLGLINSELENYSEANKHVEAAAMNSFAGSPRLKRDAYQVEAYIYLKSGRLPECHTILRKAFFIAKKHQLIGGWLCWSHRMMSCLCTEAVKNGIEPEYVRRLIRERKLNSEDPILDAWPWPIKIYTLGNFDILADNRRATLPINQSERRQPKLLVMLKAIIASGGKDVRIDDLCEILWPEAEGDRAASVFTTTLARLRKLVGQETLHISNGRISIDTRRCWVDALALDLYIDNIILTDMAIEPLEIIARFYRGPFLKDDIDDWAQAYRDKIRKRVSQIIRQCLDASNPKDDRRKAKYLISQIEAMDDNLSYH